MALIKIIIILILLKIIFFEVTVEIFLDDLLKFGKIKFNFVGLSVKIIFYKIIKIKNQSSPTIKNNNMMDIKITFDMEHNDFLQNPSKIVFLLAYQHNFPKVI